MAHRTWRFGGAAIVICAALLGACGGGDGATNDTVVGDSMTSDSTTTTVADASASTTTTETGPTERLIEVKVVGGRAEGGVKRESVKLGETVRLRVISDVDEEVHVHGYDIEFNTGHDSGEIVFEATIPGVFEVELHRNHREILKLEVSP